jgi:crossover junction endodeoxyribonuclease RuvC
MKLLGLDVSSSSTGWTIIESSNNSEPILLEFGLIRGDSSMSTTQRLYFQCNEIKKILEKFKPDEIAIEETVFVHGPKIMKILARFSGVAMYQCFAYNKKEPYFYEPAMWKKSIGIGGNAIKAEVQLAVCGIFNKLTKEVIENYKTQLSKIDEQVKIYKSEAKLQKIEKKEKSKKIKEIEKQYNKISTDIFSDSGINNDIADSIGICLCLKNELKN